MKVRDLIKEMFTAGDLNAGLDWDETPADVKDFDGNPSKLPVEIPDEYREDKKKKKRAKRKSSK